MKTGYTHITLVVDRSGSMMATRADAEGGLRAFVAEQKAQPGQCTFTLFDFDEGAEMRYHGPIDKFPDYTLVPRGWTALYDAMGVAITHTGTFLSLLPEAQRPEHVVFVTITDGDENSSRDWSHEQLRKLVDDQTARYKWQFVFLGSNIDAAKVGHGIGVRNTTQYDAGSTQSVYASTAQSVSNLRSRAGGQSINVVDDVTGNQS